jgi:sugar lactone lactonase YvrE
VARYDGPVGGYDEAEAIAVSPDGTRVFVTGLSASGSSRKARDYATIAYSVATGSPLWVRRYDGPIHAFDEAEALAVSADGSKVFVTGNSRGSEDQPDWATIAYGSATGTPLWVRRLGDATLGGSANAMAVSPDGATLFVTGVNSIVSGNGDFVTVGYDTQTGVERWVASYDKSGDTDAAEAIAISPDGSRVFVAGRASGPDYATIAYDAVSGTQLWAEVYAGDGSDDANSVAVSPDGSEVVVTGTSFSFGGNDDYFTIAFSAATGDEKWSQRYDGSGGGDTASSLAVTPDGSAIFVTGSASSDYVTVAYSASTGTPLGVKVYDGRLHLRDEPEAVTVSPDGSTVFVSGTSQELLGSSYDYVTLAYAV